MRPEKIAADNTVFVILSFEGPDGYSCAGGLGVRVEGLSLALASMGFTVHVFFVGDHQLPGEETVANGRLVLHRWCQWISKHHPKGVYDGEWEKIRDFSESIPSFVMDRVVGPAVKQDKLVVILGEEWHTAEAMCRLSDELDAQALRDRAVMFWNANNTFGFDCIDWGRLDRATTITTVSKYMKHVMWKLDVNPLVIANGIPASLLARVDDNTAGRIRGSTRGDVLLTKIARYHPDKRWSVAVDATALLKAKGHKGILMARGGTEAHGRDVMDKARSAGLRVDDVYSAGNTIADYIDAIGSHGGADILDLKFHCPQSFLRLVYRASDAVLANSGHEPFGLVGLETMAAGGIAFTGCTGEDYAIHMQNSVVLDTADPEEIETYVTYLLRHPEENSRIRRAARETAWQFTWERAVANLTQRLEHQARSQGLIVDTEPSHDSALSTVYSAHKELIGKTSSIEHEPVLTGSR